MHSPCPSGLSRPWRVLAALAALVLAGLTPLITSGRGAPAGAADAGPSAPKRSSTAPAAGYWLVASDGGVFPFGDAVALGTASSLRSVAAMAPTPTGAGYWQVGADGSLAAFGDAVDLGHPSGGLTRPIVGMAVFSAPGTGTTTVPTTTGTPGSDPSSTTTSTTAPLAVGPYRLYASHALDGTYGTPPQVVNDPSHPNRQVCDHPPCTTSNANYAEEIRVISKVGNRLFIGGFFHNLVDSATAPPGKGVDPAVGFLAELDATTGKPAADQTFTTNNAPDGTVEAMAVSPDGKRLYIGGRFLHIGGRQATRIAALDLQTNRLDPTFAPPAPDESVHGIAVAGDRVFIGGSFTNVGSAKYPGLAALNAADGSLVTGFVPPPNYGGSFIGQAGTATESTQGVVYAIAVTGDGSTLVVGGDFLHFGTTPAADPHSQKSGLIALNTADGSLSSWRPHNNRPVFGIALSPDGKTVYTAQGGGGGAMAAFSPGADEPLWIGHVDGDALGVAATDQRVYLGGHFDVEEEDPNAPCLRVAPTRCMDSPTATPHRHLVAWDLQGHVDNTWTAQADTAEGPTFLLATPEALYLGGNFEHTLDKYYRDGGVGIFHPGFAMFPAVG
jgi:hypothetical protein